MRTTLAVLVVAGLSVWAASAQEKPSTPLGSGSPGVGKPVDQTPPTVDHPAPDRSPLSERPVVVPPVKKGQPEKPEKPERPQRPSGVVEMQDLIKDFQSARDSYLKDRQELLKQLKAATAEERAALREQMKQNMAEWREAQKQHAQELRDAAKDIKNSVGSVSDIIDSAKQEGRGK